MDQFKCYSCKSGFQHLNKVIQHSVKEHCDEPLKIRSLSLNEVTGKRVYVRKDFNILPSEIKAQGKEITVEDGKVFVHETANVEPEKTDNTSTCLDEQVDNSTFEGKDGLQRLQALLPEAIAKLENSGHLQTWISFHEMLADGTFPMDNIAFRLFMDVVRFFSLPTSAVMRYSNDVKQFWRTGYQLFKGRFLRFMGGPKHAGQMDDDTLDCKFDPLDARINFAVPKAKFLETASVIKEEVKPGILHECLKSVSEHTKQAKVSFDGKKINSSLYGTKGDVNLFGCEPPPTHSDLNARKTREEEFLKTVTERAESGALNHRDVQCAMQTISIRLKELREIACLKEESVKKFKSLGLPDWKTSKYIYVISGLQSSLFEIREAIKKCLHTTDELCRISAEMQGVDHMYCSGSSSLDFGQQANFTCIVDNETEFHTESTESTEITRHVVKQRSSSWHGVRSKAKVTGSSAHKAMGLSTLKEQVSFFDQKLHGKQPPEFSEMVQKCLDHGVQHEKDALATLVGKVLPAYYPHLKYVEEGCSMMKSEGKNFLVVSPDGSGRTEACQPASLAFEFKCPYAEKRFKPQVHYSIPHYYVIQLLCEMAALQCTSMIFLSYTTESTTVFKVTFSPTLWNRVWAELLALYGDDIPKRPSKLSKTVSALKEELTAFVSENTEFLGEVPSLVGKPCEHEFSGNVPFFQNHTKHGGIQQTADGNKQTVLQTLYTAQVCVTEAFNLCRRRATEIFVFMMSDLHRRSIPTSMPSIPVAYGLQGPSLTTQTARKMLQKVLTAADNENIDVIAFSCDGQFIKLATSNLEGHPLTQLQHQKCFYGEASAIPKQTLLKYFKDLKARVDESEEHGVASMADDQCDRRLQHFKDMKLHVGGLEADGAVSIADVRMKTRHLKLLSEKARKANQSTSPEEETESTSSALNILPESLAEKLDECTYNEVVSVVKSLMSAKAKDNLTIEEDVTSITAHVTQEQLPLDSEEMLPSVNPYDGTRPIIQLDRNALRTILSALQSDDQVKDREKWKRTGDKELEEILMAGGDTLSKRMSKVEVKVCLKTVKQLLPNETKHIRLALTKGMLIRDLLQLLGLAWHASKDSKSRKVNTLKDLALKEARKLPKAILCALYSEIEYPKREKEWRQSFPYSSVSTLNDNENVSWFSFPETRTQECGRQLPLLGFIDSHHILTNLRTKCCKTGIRESGIHRDAWVRVARAQRENKTGLTLAHVDDLINRQRNSFAQLTFSEAVEEEMRKNGDETEANFCRLVRNWYRADDDGGLDSALRLQWRLSLRTWLLQRYNPHHFPPPAGYVGGIPVVTFESLLTNIERKAQMYSFAEDGSFNARALSTLDAENFFSILGDLTPGGVGLAIRPADIPRALKTACEMTILQADSNKSFFVHTTRAPVYPKLRACPPVDQLPEEREREEVGVSNMSSIQTRNHDFDMPARRQRRGKRKAATVSKPNEPSKGARGVRQHHKCDETKILPHVRLGVIVD